MAHKTIDWNNDGEYPKLYGERLFKKGLSYKNKRVMDVGADWGSTANWFLKQGAKEVIAIEGKESGDWELLEENAKKMNDVIPVCLWISEPKHFEELILKYKPDILKADCEECEKYLFEVSDEVFSIVSEYIIETHDLFKKDERGNRVFKNKDEAGTPIFDALKAKCEKNNYEIVDINAWAEETWGFRICVVYMRKREKND